MRCVPETENSTAGRFINDRGNCNSGSGRLHTTGPVDCGLEYPVYECCSCAASGGPAVQACGAAQMA